MEEKEAVLTWPGFLPLFLNPSRLRKQYESFHKDVSLTAKPVGDLEKPFRESTITRKERMETTEPSDLDNYFVY